VHSEKEKLLGTVQAIATDLDSVSRYLYENPETAYREHNSCRWLCDFLETRGFKVQTPAGGLDTAFLAVPENAIPTRPKIAFLAEYDALEKIGHGCGHNLLGAGSVFAAIAAARGLLRHGLHGTIRLYGCPAEETVEGKVFMARAGVFDGLSCCIQWHPSSENAVSLESSNALNQFELEFFGRTAHSAGAPWVGRSALDAVEIMNVATNYLREHLPISQRMHYVVLEGGEAPNVVPDKASVWYYVRNTDERLEDMYRRVVDCAKAGALAAGVELASMRVVSAAQNSTLES